MFAIGKQIIVQEKLYSHKWFVLVDLIPYLSFCLIADYVHN